MVRRLVVQVEFFERTGARDLRHPVQGIAGLAVLKQFVSWPRFPLFAIEAVHEVLIVIQQRFNNALAEQCVFLPGKTRVRLPDVHPLFDLAHLRPGTSDRVEHNMI
jgi:hypothetical protein